MLEAETRGGPQVQGQFVCHGVCRVIHGYRARSYLGNK